MNEAADDKRLPEVLAATGPVLLDFDGPVCRVYRGDLNAQAAERLKELLRSSDLALPRDVEQTQDPLAVLRYAGELESRLVVEKVEQVLTDIEVEAVVDAPPTPGAADFLRACADANRPVVIVSNNAGEAIVCYLRAQGLSHLVRGIVGRSHARPQEMKPHPEPIQRGLEILAATPQQTLLVGDSVTDIKVGKQTGLRTVAYVNRPGKRQQLHDQSPDAVVDDMTVLASLTRSVKG